MDEQPFQVMVVCDRYDAAGDDASVVRNALLYGARGIVDDQTGTHRDWPLDELRDRCATAGYVVVVLDGRRGDAARTIGAKCAAAIDAAQAHDRPYLVLCPYAQYRAINGAALEALEAVEDEDQRRAAARKLRMAFLHEDGSVRARVPLDAMTISVDHLLHRLLELLYEETPIDTQARPTPATAPAVMVHGVVFTFANSATDPVTSTHPAYPQACYAESEGVVCATGGPLVDAERPVDRELRRQMPRVGRGYLGADGRVVVTTERTPL